MNTPLDPSEAPELHPESHVPPDSRLGSHLDDDQFAACTLGEPLEPAVAAHLAACEACRDEVDEFLASAESFNVASLAWSEAQSETQSEARMETKIEARNESQRETQPSASLRTLARRREAQPAWAVASWALAGCLMLGSVVSVTTYRLGHKATAGPATAATEDSPAQIERDNRLLFAVYEATSAKASSPLQEYGLNSASTVRTAASSQPNDHD